MFRCVELGHEERVEGGGMNAITSREWSFLCVQSECHPFEGSFYFELSVHYGYGLIV